MFTPQALGGGYHAQLVALCESAGFYPKVVQEAAQIHTLLGLVACGFGVALVPASFVRSTPRERVRFCPIRPIDDQPPPGLGLYMKWNAQNASPALANFIAMFETQQ
ncbi:DNA-binding transcriptional activator XapR [compost metagenome]